NGHIAPAAGVATLCVKANRDVVIRSLAVGKRGVADCNVGTAADIVEESPFADSYIRGAGGILVEGIKPDGRVVVDSLVAKDSSRATGRVVTAVYVAG